MTASSKTCTILCLANRAIRHTYVLTLRGSARLGTVADWKKRTWWLGVHGHPRTHLLDALSDHTFTWFQAFRNHPLAAWCVADFDRTNAHFVLAIHNRHLIIALQLRDGALWDD